jgi:hypothetical protein
MRSHLPPLRHLASLTEELKRNAYDIRLYLARASLYRDLGYPDLAAGDAYRAALLVDYVREYTDSGELSFDGERAKEEEEEEEEEEGGDEKRADAEEFRAGSRAVGVLRQNTEVGVEVGFGVLEEEAMFSLASALLGVGCGKEAGEFCSQGSRRWAGSGRFPELGEEIAAAVEVGSAAGGRARRLVYPWNCHEPDRFAEDTVRRINGEVMPKASECVEVRVVELPLLSRDTKVLGSTKHLGMFAKRDVAVGEVCLREESALTVVTDPEEGGLCEYCGQKWRKEVLPSRPVLKLRVLGVEEEQVEEREEEVIVVEEEEEEERETYTCELCVEAEVELDEVVVPVWCSKHCRDAAMQKYHPALCRRPIAPIHRAANTPPQTGLMQVLGQTTRTGLTAGSQPGGSVYTLLMMKAFAMALTQGIHPLELEEVKFLYGVPPVEEGDLRIGWGWEENVRGVVGVLEALGIDVFDGKWRCDGQPPLKPGREEPTPEWWNTWVVNTLIAKFRGVASGRLDSRGWTEAAAAHTLYSLVNHDCEPNVEWECGGIMEFRGIVDGDGEVAVRKGEELYSCYCDRRLGYRERREWMMGCLGGACMCNRCLREENADRERGVNGTAIPL